MNSPDIPSFKSHDPGNPAPGRIARLGRALMPGMASRSGSSEPSPLHHLPILPDGPPDERTLGEKIADLDAAHVGYAAENLTRAAAPPIHNVLTSVDPGDLQELLGTFPRNENGDLVPAVDQRKELIDTLNAVPGLISSDQVTPLERNMAVARGQRAVTGGKATGFLQRLLFLDKRSLPKDGTYPTATVYVKGELSIDPEHIVNAHTLKSWTGMGYTSSGTPIGKHENDDRAVPARSSLGVILDYASRSTQLPPLDIMDVYLTDEGMFASSTNSHRAAAAQLRREPLQIDVMHLHDLRGDGVSEATQRGAQSAMRIVRYNTHIQNTLN